MFGLIAFGGTVFWILATIAAVVALFAVSSDKYTWAFVALVAGVILFPTDMITGTWRWINANPYTTIEIVIGYITIGMIFSVIRWYAFLVEVRHKLRVFKKDRNITGPLRKEDKSDFERKINPNNGRGGKCRTLSIPPQIADYKDRVLLWMTWWPLSMIDLILVQLKPLTVIFETAYMFLRAVFQNMSNHMFKGME